MGEKLLMYYKYITDTKGIEGRMLLAHMTHIPTPKAAIEADNQENINKFREAVQKITNQEAPLY
jgi:hypothetical protein